MAEYDLYLRDPDLQRIGMITNYEKFMLNLKFNAAGKWSVSGFGDCPFPTNDKRYGLLVRRNGQYIFSGIINKIAKETVFKSGKIAKTWTVEGIDDLGRIGRRVAHPSPVDMTPGNQAHDIRTGDAETVISEYVAYNAGPLAVTYRQILGLQIAETQARGNSVTGRARFNNLLDFITGLANLGGLGVNVYYDQEAASLTFGCFVPVNRTDTIKFGTENVKEYKFSETAPKYNHVFVLGQGDLTERVIAQAVDPNSIAEWELIEGTKDQRNEADPTALYQWGLQSLSENGDKTGFSITPMETDTIGYKLGLDYNLGDIVSVSDGEKTMTDIVGQIKIEVAKTTGELISPQIGKPDATMTPFASTLQRIDDVESRIIAMELNK
jgi:hypothetical protein